VTALTQLLPWLQLLLGRSCQRRAVQPLPAHHQRSADRQGTCRVRARHIKLHARGAVICNRWSDVAHGQMLHAILGHTTCIPEPMCSAGTICSTVLVLYKKQYHTVRPPRAQYSSVVLPPPPAPAPVLSQRRCPATRGSTPSMHPPMYCTQAVWLAGTQTVRRTAQPRSAHLQHTHQVDVTTPMNSVQQ
jgi:hypothetical protein